MFYPSIRTRITLPYLIAIAITSAIGVFIVTQLVAGSVQERFNNQLLDSAQAATNTVTDVERQQLATLRSMAFTQGIADAIVAGDVAEIEQLLRPIAVNEQVDDVIVFDHKGQALYQLQRIELPDGVEFRRANPPELSEREGVRRITDEETDVLGDKFVDIIETDSQVLLYLNAPVINAEKALVGGISIGLTADHLAERVGEQSLSAVTLYREDGSVLGSTFRGVDSAALEVEAQDMPFLMTEAQDGSPIRNKDIQGVGYQTLYAPLQIRSQSIGLIGVSLSSGFIVDRISTSRNYIALLFAVLFGLIAVIGLATARSIVRPVYRLVDTTRAIREGDLSRRVRLQARDELGELGVSFDHMTDQLVQRNREIIGVLTSISDPVMVQDFEGNVLLRNPAAEQVSPQLPPELVKNPAQLTEPRTLALNNQYFSALSTPVRMDDNTLLGYVMVLRDITALVQAEQLKDEMMKQLSHELRTPLTAARGYLELGIMLSGAVLPETSQTYLNNSVDNLTILERLINQVIDVTAMLSDQWKLELETVNFEDIVQQQVAQWQPLYEKRTLTLHYANSTGAVEIRGDWIRLGQVLDHILRNAYSYTLPGGRIDVTLSRVPPNVVCLSIRDTGVGIAAHEIDKVFERMYRGESADAGDTDARGMGLGLYFSKRIVEAHQGTIDLQSQVNVGTTVTIQLPIEIK